MLERKTILRQFRLLKPREMNDLIFLLEVPIQRRPPNVLDFEDRKSRFLDWAIEEGVLQDLADELNEIVAKRDVLPSARKPAAARVDTAESPALTIWKEKLEFLLEQKGTLSDPAQLFTLRKQIDEARKNIDDLGG